MSVRCVGGGSASRDCDLKDMVRYLALILILCGLASAQTPPYEELELPFHTAQIRVLDTNPDRRLLASLSYDDRVFVWRTGSSDPLLSLQSEEPAHHLALSPSGALLAVVLEQEAVIYEVSSGKPLTRLTGHESTLQKADFSPGGDLLVTSSKDKTVRAWRVSDWQQLYALEHPEVCDAVAFSPDGETLATGSGWEFGEVRLWDARTGQEIRKMSLDTPEEMAHPSAFLMPSNVLAFSSDGTRLVSGEYAGCRVWDTGSGLLQRTVGQENRGGGPGTTAACLSGDRLRFWDGRVLVEIDLQSGERLGERVLPQDAVAVSLLDDGQAAVGYLHGKVALEGANGDEIWSASGLDEAVEDLDFQEDSPRLFGVTLSGTFLEWDGRSGRISRRVETSTPKVRAFAFVQKGTELAHGTEDGLALRSSENFELLARMSGHRAMVRDVEVSEDGRWAATASEDGTVGVWDLQEKKLVRLLKGHQDAVVDIALAPDGESVVSVSEDATVRLWSLESGRELARLERPGRKTPYSAAAISPDGTLLAVAEAFLQEQPVVIWDLEKREILRTIALNEDNSGAMDLSFSEDGTLWAADLTGTLSSWDPRSGEKRLALPTGSGYGWALAVGEDGQILALGTTGQQRAVRFWTKRR